MAKAVKKSSTTKPRTTTTKKAAPKRSASRSSYTEPFMVVRFSRETIYWIILGVISVGFGMWVLLLQQRVNDLYQQIDSLNTANEILDMKQRYYTKHPDQVKQKTSQTDTKASADISKSKS